MDTLIVAVRVVLSLGVVLALLWYLQRRLSRGSLVKSVAHPVTVVGRAPIGQKASVVVIEVDGTRLVLGVTEQAVTVLHEKPLAPNSSLDDAVALLGGPAAESAPAAAFARSLAAATETGTADAAAPVGAPVAAASTRLAGSILSPATWRQTATLLRQGR